MSKLINVDFVVTTDGNTFLPDESTVIEQYTLEVENTPTAIRDAYQEARKFWSEYYVIARTDAYEFSASHTYADELAKESMYGESTVYVDFA